MCSAGPTREKDHKPTRVRYKLAGGGPVNEESREKGASKGRPMAVRKELGEVWWSCGPMGLRLWAIDW